MTSTTILIGNLTREPEIRYTRDGLAAATLGVAVNRRWRSPKTEEWEESTSFFEVVCWRELAENAVLSLTKGMQIVVTGRLEHRSWEGADGERRSAVELVADDVGPSLRHATAEVQRTERRGAEDEGPPVIDGEPDLPARGLTAAIDPVSPGCGRRAPAPGVRVPLPGPVGFRDVVQFSKQEVLEVCGRLAVAHQALAQSGDGRAAAELAWVFGLLDRRLCP